MSSYNEISSVTKGYLNDYHDNKMSSSNEISFVTKRYINDYYDNNFKNPQLKNWFKNRKFFKKCIEKNFKWRKEVLYSSYF